MYFRLLWVSVIDIYLLFAVTEYIFDETLFGPKW